MIPTLNNKHAKQVHYIQTLSNTLCTQISVLLPPRLVHLQTHAVRKHVSYSKPVNVSIFSIPETENVSRSSKLMGGRTTS